MQKREGLLSWSNMHRAHHYIFTHRMYLFWTCPSKRMSETAKTCYFIETGSELFLSDRHESDQTKVVLPVKGWKATPLKKLNTDLSIAEWLKTEDSVKTPHQILHPPDLWWCQWHSGFTKLRNKSPHLTKSSAPGGPYISYPDTYLSQGKKNPFPQLTAIWFTWSHNCSYKMP